MVVLYIFIRTQSRINEAQLNSTALVDTKLKAICNAALGKIVRSHFYFDFVANPQTNAIHAHFAGEMSDNLMAAFQLYAKCGCRK